MNKENIIVYVSSRNNYDMLEGEVFKNINFEGFEFINIDDRSSEEEIKKGKLICKDKNVEFIENKGAGVQMATQTLIDFINTYRPNCKWIICFQHDNYPLTKNFFTQISNYISKGSLDNFGVLGFNHLDFWDYTGFSYYKYLLGFKPIGMVGMPHLSYLKNNKWLCARQYGKILRNPNWKTPFLVEFPVWPSVGINIKLWNKFIQPTEEYEFHLWLPDIAFQFIKNEIENIIIPDLCCLNHQRLKNKYNINVNSAIGAKEGNEYHFGKYSNFDAWKNRWGWDFENSKSTYIPKNNNSLMDKFYFHDISKGPLKNYSL